MHSGLPSKDRQEPERKALNMVEKNLSYQSEQQRFTYFQALRKQSAYQQQRIDVKKMQHVEPYFEYLNACAGCGETPYIRILTQLFGDRLMIANATGCSSILAAIYPRRLTVRIVMDEVLVGPTFNWRIMPNLGWG